MVILLGRRSLELQGVNLVSRVWLLLHGLLEVSEKLSILLSLILRCLEWLGLGILESHLLLSLHLLHIEDSLLVLVAVS